MRDGRRWVDVTERAIYLRSIPVTAELPPHVRHAVAISLVDRELEPGAFLTRAGEPVPSLFLLTEGKLGLRRDGKDLGTLAPPQSIGFLNVVARSPGQYDAVALEPIRALELAGPRLHELMEDHFELTAATIRYVGQRLLAELKELPAEMLNIAAEKIPIEVPERPLDVVEKVFFLRCMSAFRRANVNALATLAESMEELRWKKGEVLWHAGEPNTYTLFLAKGTCVNETPDGRVFRYGPGTAVGGTEAIAHQGRWYTTRAETDLVGLRGSVDQLFGLLEDNFDLASDFASVLAGALAGIVARKANGAGAVFAQKREVSNLGAVPVGA